MKYSLSLFYLPTIMHRIMSASKQGLTFILILTSLFCSAQVVPLAEIEGRLSIFLPDDTTSVHIGRNAGVNQDLSDIRFNTFVGTNAGEKTTVGEANNFFGAGAGLSNTTGSYNSYFGFYSGTDNEEGEGNSFFGAFSGDHVFTDTNEGSYNSYFGLGTGANTTTGSYNNFFGIQAGLNIKSGKQNVGIGAFALHLSDNSGSYNTAVGDSSMYRVDTDGDIWGENNSALGAGSLYAKVDHESNNSVAVGYHAGYDGGSRSIFLGHMAGKGASQRDDVLFIDNQPGDTPLIYGEFDNDLVRIHGDVYSTGQVRMNNANDIEFLLNDSMTYKPVLTLHTNNDTFLDGYDDLRFRTGVATIDRMIIDQDGNIGVGTTTPTAPLHINHFMKLEPTTNEPDCSDSNDEGRIYYEAGPVHKLRVCTTTNGTTFFWADLH